MPYILLEIIDPLSLKLTRWAQKTIQKSEDYLGIADWIGMQTRLGMHGMGKYSRLQTGYVGDADQQQCRLL